MKEIMKQHKNYYAVIIEQRCWCQEVNTQVGLFFPSVEKNRCSKITNKRESLEITLITSETKPVDTMFDTTK